MSALENEIVNKFRQLDEASKRRLLQVLEHEVEQSRSKALDEWLTWAAAFREQLAGKYGNVHFNIQDALDEVREEASWLDK